MSNTPTGTTLEIAPGDEPMVMEALSVQACTELMCGRRAAMKRVKAMQDALAPAIPAASKPFDAGDWALICAVIRAGAKPQISIERPDWKSWGSEGAIKIEIGGAVWRSQDSNFSETAEILGEIRAYLEALAPLPDSLPAK